MDVGYTRKSLIEPTRAHNVQTCRQSSELLIIVQEEEHLKKRK